MMCCRLLRVTCICGMALYWKSALVVKGRPPVSSNMGDQARPNWPEVVVQPSAHRAKPAFGALSLSALNSPPSWA